MRKGYRVWKMMTIAVLAMILLCACGGKDMSDSEYLGTWSASTAEYSGIEISVDTVFDEFTFTLKDNGKVDMSVNGEEESGKWDETDSGISLDDDLQFEKLDENTLTYETEGITIYFVRE